MVSVNSLIDKFDPRGSTFQVMWSVTRTNTRDAESCQVLTMDGAQKYQLMMVDHLRLHYWNLIPNMLGLELDNDPFYADERSNLTFVGDLVHVPVGIDIAFIHERYTQVRVMTNIAENLGFPIVYIEHKMPEDGYKLTQMTSDLKDANVVFRNRSSQKAWGYDDSNSHVIHDGIFTIQRKYSPTSSKWYTIHEHIELDHNDLWYKVRDNKPLIELRGNNGCVAYETREVEESSLLDRYCGYVNFRKDDLLPIDMLKAFGRGMPVMSPPNDELRRFFQDKKSIFFVESLEDVNKVIGIDKGRLKEVGREGRKVIEKHFNVKQFCEAWGDLIDATIYK